jgi:hypothetical protein
VTVPVLARIALAAAVHIVFAVAVVVVAAVHIVVAAGCVAPNAQLEIQ